VIQLTWNCIKQFCVVPKHTD